MMNKPTPELDSVSESVSQELDLLINTPTDDTVTESSESSQKKLKLVEATDLETIEESTNKVQEELANIEKAEEIAKTIDTQTEVKRPQTLNLASPTFLSVLFTLLAIAVGFYFFIQYASSRATFITEDPYSYELPAKGKLTSIKDINTFWLRPKEKHNVSNRLTIVPAATITLDDASTGDAEIRVVFYSDQENALKTGLLSKGDSRTLTIKGGLFGNGTKTASVYATDGFEDFSYLGYYRRQKEKCWTIEISEGTPGSNFEAFSPILRAPITPVIREL